MTGADASDPRLAAAIDLIGRSGAKGFQIRYSDDEEPTVWMAVASYRVGPDGVPRAEGVERAEVAAALTPHDAAVRLCEAIIDGGFCVHCRRTSGVATDWQNEQPLAEHVCWYVYDPETEKFRRSCEGEAKFERNGPCWCGSGKKFKRCHGA